MDHCFRNAAGHITKSLRLPSAHNWHNTKPASIVLPSPTSSANITPLERGELKANKAAFT